MQNDAGLVFVAAAPTTPVLVRVNFDDARFNGVEFNSRARFTDQFSGTGNFTYIRAHSLLNGLPPNVEGGIPPATGFVSLRYQPRSRFYVEGYSTMAGGRIVCRHSISPIEEPARRVRELTFKTSSVAERVCVD